MERNAVEGSVQATEQQLRELFGRGLGGDPAAYHEFLTRLGAHLRAWFRKRLTHLPDDVEDLVQETLLAVHNQRHTYDMGRPLTAWVHAIARYKFVDFFRRRAASRGPLTDPLGDEHELFAAVDGRVGEARRDLARLLERLPDRQRLPIIYVKLEGLSVLEAAERTGMSVSAVKIGVHRGLKALSALLHGGERA